MTRQILPTTLWSNTTRFFGALGSSAVRILVISSFNSFVLFHFEFNFTVKLKKKFSNIYDEIKLKISKTVKFKNNLYLFSQLQLIGWFQDESRILTKIKQHLSNNFRIINEHLLTKLKLKITKQSCIVIKSYIIFLFNAGAIVGFLQRLKENDVSLRKILNEFFLTLLPFPLNLGLEICDTLDASVCFKQITLKVPF